MTSGIAMLRRYRALWEARCLARSAGRDLSPAEAAELEALEQALADRLREPAPPAAPSAPGEQRLATVFCDGACSGNPGPGGYGALVRIPGQPEKAISGGKGRTTNNEMELTAAAAAIKLALALGATAVHVQSDSEYLIKGMTQWLPGWQRNGWRTSTGGAVKNRARWEELVELSRRVAIRFTWVRGHAGHPENERCDAMAVAAARAAAQRVGQPEAGG